MKRLIESISQRKNVVSCLLGLTFFLFGNLPANAGTVVDLVGDKDGFGVPGAPAVPADGTLWRDGLGGTFFTDYRDAGDLANAPFTDWWDSPASFNYNHTYSLGASTATSAVLDIQIAGIGDVGGPYDFLVNGTSVGQIPANGGVNAFQEVRLYSFNVPTNLITQSDSIQVSGTGGDGYIVNFSELTIQTIPEASTLALGVLGLLGVGFVRNKPT